MSQPYTRNLVKSIPVTIITALSALLLSYLTLPTNVGYVFWGCAILAIVSYYVINTNERGGRRFMIAATIGGIAVLLIGSLFMSPIVFTRIDNAKYFDDLLTYADDDELPFQNPINGSELRVVDRELAQSIMDRTNPFGSNRGIYSIHLGNYQGDIYWIGAGIFDGLITNDDNNRVVGFILVDITDPTEVPIILRTDFELDARLRFNHDTNRAIWFEDINYMSSDNTYFSYNDDAEQMELIVPYSIRDNAFLGDPHGGFVTSDMNLDGGVLIFGPNGDLIRDYKSSERDQLPEHARIQAYSETWLEDQIGWWGRSIVADNEVRWSTALPWVRSERLLGIDDDIRVVINPDNFRTVQYVLLDSTDSTNQILRGAIKANTTGLFYYNFERYQFIDTNSAHEFVAETITNIRQTSTHGYKALLPILYPVRENVTDLYDYAYVMPLQLGDSRFGGIAVTDPSDKTGTRTIVEFVEAEQRANVSETVEVAIDRYLTLIDEGNQTIPEVPDDGITGNFTVEDIRSYEDAGSTVYVMNGTFSELEGYIRVVFSQEFITNEQEWLDVVFTNNGDIMEIVIEFINGIYYATDILG